MVMGAMGRDGDLVRISIPRVYTTTLSDGKLGAENGYI